jgi:hypothetical protein
MVIEILLDGPNVLVRRFGQELPRRWSVVPPKTVDRVRTGMTHEELRKLGSGVWELRARAG